MLHIKCHNGIYFRSRKVVDTLNMLHNLHLVHVFNSYHWKGYSKQYVNSSGGVNAKVNQLYVYETSVVLGMC